MMIISNLEKILKTRKITQKELAEKIGISRQAVSAAIKSGDFKVSTLEKIAKALNVNIGYFFEDKSNIDISGQVQIGNRNKQNMNYKDQCQDLKAKNDLLNEKLNSCQELLKSKDDMIEVLKSK